MSRESKAKSREPSDESGSLDLPRSDTQKTPGESKHHLVVSGWLERAARGHGCEALISAFEAAFAALWQQSCLTLGEVTLSAIIERVLHHATKRFPVLGSLEIEASGLNCQDLRARTNLSMNQISEGISFVLTEFLTVLGKLTAEILTDRLHAELSKQLIKKSHYDKNQAL